jgi:hypothetical protein
MRWMSKSVQSLARDDDGFVMQVQSSSVRDSTVPQDERKAV